MSLNYLLKLKNKYNLILFSMSEIIDNYEEMIILAAEEYESFNNLDKTNELYEIKKELLVNDASNFLEIQKMYNLLKGNTLCHKEKVNENIKLRCNHNFIEDTIDIDPDKCKVINYCEYCGITKDA